MNIISNITHNIYKYEKEITDGVRDQMNIDIESQANAIAVSNVIVKLIQAAIGPTRRMEVFHVASRLIPFKGTTQDSYEACNLIGMVDILGQEYDNTNTLLKS